MRPGNPDPMSVRQAEKSWWDEESLALLTHELRNGLGPIASALQHETVRDMKGALQVITARTVHDHALTLSDAPTCREGLRGL